MRRETLRTNARIKYVAKVYISSSSSPKVVSMKPTFNRSSEILFLSWNISQTLDLFHRFRLWSEIPSFVTAGCKFLSDIFTAVLNTQRNFWQWSRKMYLVSWLLDVPTTVVCLCVCMCVCGGGGGGAATPISIFRVEKCSWSLRKHRSGPHNRVWINYKERFVFNRLHLV